MTLSRGFKVVTTTLLHTIANDQARYRTVGHQYNHNVQCTAVFVMLGSL